MAGRLHLHFVVASLFLEREAAALFADTATLFEMQSAERM
jgi:hypothetical protein